MKKIGLLIVVGTFILLGCANKKQLSNGASTIDQLNGTWELEYVSGPRIAFNGLYSDKKPTLTFDAKTKRISGNTSCNSLNGPLEVNGNKINFNGPFAVTKMFCPGEGENVFLASLNKVNTFSISDKNTLNLMMGDIAIMRFKKK